MADQPSTHTPHVATTPPAEAAAPVEAGGPPPGWEPTRPSRAPLVISVLALVLAAGAAALSIWQAVLAKRNEVLNQRAFIHVAGPLTSVVPDAQDRSAASLLVTAVLTNSGNTPTKDLRFFIRCVTSGTPVDEPWTLLFQDTIEKRALMIGPHATANAQCTFSPTQLWQIGEGKLYGYVLGDIAYHSRSDDKTLRRTQFAWRLSDVRLDPVGCSVALTAVPQGQHNCADEECPLAIMTR
jgi:hypothetical protein